MATSGYSTMGGSSSGGHLAGEGMEAESESLEEGRGSGRVRGVETTDSDLMGTMIPSGVVHTEFDRQPSPVATLPTGVLASTISITTAAEANHTAKATQPPPPPPPKPSRMTINSDAARRQSSEFGLGVHVSLDI